MISVILDVDLFFTNSNFSILYFFYVNVKFIVNIIFNFFTGESQAGHSINQSILRTMGTVS